MLRLRRGTYEEVGTSEVFPGVSAQSVSRMLAQGKALGGTGWLRLAARGRTSTTASPRPSSSSVVIGPFALAMPAGTTTLCLTETSLFPGALIPHTTDR